MSAYRRWLRVAVVTAVAVSPTVPTSPLVAQGGGQARRPAAAPSSDAAPHTFVEPARSILRHLVGRWRVEIRFAGNFDGAPDASGTRVVEALYDDLRLQWTEDLDSAQSRGQGVIGFDPKSGRFYSTATYSTGSGAELLTGSVDRAEPVILFTPLALAPDAVPVPERQAMQSFILRMVDADHFTWSPLDRGWRAVLTRER